MESEASQHLSVTAMRTFNSTQSDKAEKKKNFCKRVRACFRFISLVEYRTPLYFSNKHSYISATSGVLTILSGLVLAVILFFIFVPIFKMENYISETKNIRIRG